MRHSQHLLFLPLLLLVSLTASAQKDTFNPIYTGVNSLNIAPDSRGGGMGDLGVATEPDVNSQYWNPAKYPFNINRAGVSLSYTPWLRKLVNDINLAYLSGFYRIGDQQAISASLRYFSLGEVNVGKDVASDIGYTINPYEMAIDVAYSRLLSEKLSGSVALRYIYSDLAYKQDNEVSAGSAVAADIAMYYNNYLMLGDRECLLGLGFNASNIGSKISYDNGNSSEFLPTNLRVGGSLLVPLDEFNTISFSADLNKLMVPTRPKIEDGEAPEDYQDRLDRDYRNLSPISGIFKSFGDAPGGFKEELQEIQWSIGTEYLYNNQFAVRAGYHYEHENKGNRKYFTMGAGFKMNVLSIDASYLLSTAQSNPLDQTLRFTLSFDMDGLKQIFGRN